MIRKRGGWMDSEARQGRELRGGEMDPAIVYRGTQAGRRVDARARGLDFDREFDREFDHRSGRFLQSEEEQFGNISEIEGRGLGEFDGSVGNVKHGAVDDFSERGLYADENYSRDSYGFGDASVVSGSYDSPRTDRLFELYSDAGESEFSIRNSEGLNSIEDDEFFGAVAGSREQPAGRTTAKQRFEGKGPRIVKISDGRLKDRIAENLAAHPDIDASELELEVREQRVFLDGKVDSLVTKWEVEELAANIAGVKDVENRVRVKRRDKAG